ncbi:MAG: AraC family transcriptional regulator [Tannerellaceae bacterium]|nr:AraC family transcriptional regulator [Tannerellaceae bacterium]
MAKDRQETEPDVLKRLAHLLGTEVKNNRLEIPDTAGSGYCAGFIFNEHIRMMVMHYELKEDMVIENKELCPSGRMILFKFRNIFPKTETKTLPSVLIATNSLYTEAVIPIHTHTATINIEVDADYLSSLFDSPGKSPVLQSLLQNMQPLLFEQMINPTLQNIVHEMVTGSVNRTFELFFLRIKAEELVCRLLMELEKREEKQVYPLNSYDIQTIYHIKEQMLAHPGIPPVINELAASANMSPSKLKRLFKQIFGKSLFSYYQEFRMKEAARLLKEEKLSVTDVGYQLGFTNLSHFTRVFEQHTGLKPKKYSLR